MNVAEKRKLDGGSVDLRREGLRQRGIDTAQVEAGISKDEERIRDAIRR
jgi:hypothetical protein